MAELLVEVQRQPILIFLGFAIQIVVSRQFTDASMDSLSHSGRWLAKVQLTGGHQRLPKDAFVNGLVPRGQTSRIQGLTDHAGDAVEIGFHDCLPIE